MPQEPSEPEAQVKMIEPFSPKMLDRNMVWAAGKQFTIFLDEFIPENNCERSKVI